MADHVTGSDYTHLQPGDINIPVTLRLKAATASTANDGSLPYGSTISSATVALYGPGGVAAATSHVSIVTFSSNKCTTYLTHSTALATGRHKITFTVSASLSGSTLVMTRQRDLNRIPLF